MSSGNPGQPATGTVHKPTVVASNPTTDGATNGQTEPKKEKKAKKEKTGVTRSRIARPADDHVITVLKPGIKSGKSARRYDLYYNGMTVKEYVDLLTSDRVDADIRRTVGQVYFTLRWDTDPSRNLIHIGPTVVPVPEPPPPKPKKVKKAKEEKTEQPTA